MTWPRFDKSHVVDSIRRRLALCRLPLLTASEAIPWVFLIRWQPSHMNELRAFIGHSFEEDDEEIVLVFLQYFDQIRKLRPDFSWENARSASPRDLAEKVLSLIADKNVFIGICTRREWAVPPERPSPSLWPRGFWKAPRSAFQWKTSDWILQEIGLARGRGMEIIILLEEGVRKPGGLEGNVEYIGFNREHPQECFGQILEMVQAISPRATQLIGGVSENPVKLASEVAEPPQDNNNFVEPLPSWSIQDYRRALLRGVYSENEEQLSRITAAYFATPEGANKTAKAEWNSNIEAAKILWGKGGSLDALHRLAVENPESSMISAHLARAYAQYGDFDRSAAEYLKAATIPSAPDGYWLRSRAAVQLIKAGRSVDARDVVEAMKSDTTADVGNERILLDLMAEIAGLEKDKTAEVAAMERIVEMSPDDISTRFQLAFGHSEQGNEDMALHHYRAIPQRERDQSAWNNLGVPYDRFSMPGKSVSSYRKAEEMGETLAMSNLARRLMNAGFLKEAEAEFNSSRSRTITKVFPKALRP